MKTLCIFIIRITTCFLFELFVYYTCYAQQSIFLTPQASITVTPHAKVYCHSLTWLGDAKVHLQDSALWSVSGNIVGADSNSRFFTLENHAVLTRNIGSLTSHVFPIGYQSNNFAYRGFTLDMKSLAATGPSLVSVSLVPYVVGGINYEKYFSGNNDCVSNSWVSFNCLSSDGWHCDGPDDYEYAASGYITNSCGGFMKRMIKTGTGTHAWRDSLESVVGDFASNLCDHSDWVGNTNTIPGGTYRSFSDFAIASSSSLLPVTLSKIDARVLNQKCIRVSWRTESEINNDKFLVARGTDGYSFSFVGEVPGSGTTTTSHDYFFDDGDVLPNTTYYYMVEQVDYDGAIDWSPIVSVKIEKEEVLETKTWNILGQEISENTPGVQIIQVRTASGITTTKVFKPLH